MTRSKAPTTGIAAAVALLVIASSVGAPAFGQSFSFALNPTNQSLVPAGYKYGTGTFSGDIDVANLYVTFRIDLAGAMSDTNYQVRISFIDASGNELTRAYGNLQTDSDGNGVFTSKSNIPAGTIKFNLRIQDASNFNPPLLVLWADPELGADLPL